VTCRIQPNNFMARTITHAENLNAFTIAEAEKQWFYLSEARRPRQRSGTWPPLAPELLPGYSIHEAAYCQRRQRILPDLQGRAGERIEESLEAVIHHILHEREVDHPPPANTGS